MLAISCMKITFSRSFFRSFLIKVRPCRPMLVVLAAGANEALLRQYGADLVGLDTKYDFVPSRFPVMLINYSDVAYKGWIAIVALMSNERIHACRTVFQVRIPSGY
jgi:hypothetical protein